MAGFILFTTKCHHTKWAGFNSKEKDKEKTLLVHTLQEEFAGRQSYDGNQVSVVP